jgi:hypothetical protein
MRFEFRDIHFDGNVQTRIDAILRIGGDFAVWVGNRRLYHEEEFCLVEFAVALGDWLAVANDGGPDFVYTSMESETTGLVRFTSVNPGFWTVSAAHQDFQAEDLFTTADLRQAALDYVRELKGHLNLEIAGLFVL